MNKPEFEFNIKPGPKDPGIMDAISKALEEHPDVGSPTTLDNSEGEKP